MAQNLPELHNKAISLRGYLQQENVRGPLEQALPKWLSVDRLLRIVFTSTMKNPKLLECSKESLLQSIMQCAQLGLEPILGRAYLIPYNNTKYQGGRNVKVLECQFQPGYQGLVDLARRTGVINDVYAVNVFENDEFDLTLGTDRKIYHRPWYLDKAKRESGPGKIIGSYAVWELKDGTKHPEFMTITDIFKRRDKSQAYNWAENGDKTKGGGKKDSVWHQWEEEQTLKTVIKHSSKMVPASIEFMQAVELDDAADIGKSQIGMFAEEPEYTEAPTVTEISTTETTPQQGQESYEEISSDNTPPAFAQIVKEQTGSDYTYVPAKDGVANDLLSAYIESACTSNDNMAPSEMMQMASETGVFPGFWNGFEAGTWKQHCKLKLPAEAEKESAKEPEKETSAAPENTTPPPAKESAPAPEKTETKSKPEAGTGTGNGNGNGNGASKNAFDLDWKSSGLKKVGLVRFWDTNKNEWNAANHDAQVGFEEKWIRVFSDTRGNIEKPFPGFKPEAAYVQNNGQQSQQPVPREGTTTQGQQGSITDYHKALVDLQLKDPEGLLAACDEMGYGANLVIPMTKDKQKALYETYEMVKGARNGG